MTKLDTLVDIVSDVNERSKKLAEFDSFEQAIEESKARLEKSRQQEKELTAHLDDLKNEIELVAKKRVSDITKARQEAGEIISSANEKAKALVAAAHAGLAKDKEAAQKEIDSLVSKKAGHVKDIDTLADILKHRKEKLAEIEASLAKHKDLVSRHVN